MQAADTESKIIQSKIVSRHQHRGATYSKVMDKRKRPIRGLWERNGRYYAQLTVEDQVTGIKQVKRVPMEGVSTDAQALAKLQELLMQRRKGALPVLKRTPLFADYLRMAGSGIPELGKRIIQDIYKIDPNTKLAMITEGFKWQQ